MLKKPALKLNYFIIQENSDLMKQLERRSEELQDARDQAELLEFRVLELEEERDKVYNSSIFLVLPYAGIGISSGAIRAHLT